MIRVLVVDDSIVLRKLICRLLVKDPDIEVAGQCENGEQALSFVLSHPVDVVTMDIQMPVMEGFQATKRIMEEKPVPVVVVSSCLEPDDVEKTFRAIEAGAVAVLPKPSHRPGGFEDYGEQLRRTIKDASLASVGKPLSCRIDRFGEVDCKSIKAVVVGASTGGPQALAGMLSVMPGDFPAPVFVVQHIASGFLEGMSQWLSSCTDLKVKVANIGERPSPGTVYLAPEGRHMEVSDREIHLSDGPSEHGVRPSVSVLFRSIPLSLRSVSAGVILSGMGMDGARELRDLKDDGAITFAQDRESSVIWGMPGEAVRLSAADNVLSPEEIGKALSLCARKG
ncbi:response regulator receiver modulated CheB methylesterase [Dethiosulfovibrio peptidovorans DSM 11002]|uniref:Protein-glutamate methylesterase/protein-glutamine glutaminase n=1 Tax=Dethiosulfovibrio peptidovorans DSM 11002 TaxID=469381 RepID=D2Z5P1_9BACT|nr:chemotaxis-specific protein-glutamate methyltransferase CheB [Dethiosulfovibrio peptidovorans]EFC90788.1 response regulator receiver modulated CheB methylesterase [Dethiosulfovibrio peptidovorans DSM 11002]